MLQQRLPTPVALEIAGYVADHISSSAATTTTAAAPIVPSFLILRFDPHARATKPNDVYFHQSSEL